MSNQKALLERNIAISQSLDLEIPKLVEKRDFSRYPVLVSDMRGAQQLVTELTALGFSAAVYTSLSRKETRNDIDDLEAIWIGKHVPPEVAMPAIGVALKNWPFLKYMHITGDPDDHAPPSEDNSLYFGGSTDTATKRFGLQPWTPAEINEIPARTIAEFHRAIRAHYGGE